jgi:hypothetical protein
MKYVSLKLSGVAAALCLAAAVPAMATTTLQNGDFSAGLAGWQTYGDVIVLGPRTVSVGTTASLDFQDDPPLPPGFRNNSGVPAVDLAVPPSMLAGIPVTSLDIGGFATEGSAIRQDFLATGGNILTVSFDWTFLTTEPSTVPLPSMPLDAPLGMPDFGFLALNGTVFPIVQNFDGTQIVVGRFTRTFVDSAHLLSAYPGSALYTVLPGGQVSLALGVVDIGDYLRTSELRVDNISVSAVPEPEAFAMLAAGLGLIGWKLRRRQQAQRDTTAA